MREASVNASLEAAPKRAPRSEERSTGRELEVTATSVIIGLLSNELSPGRWRMWGREGLAMTSCLNDRLRRSARKCFIGARAPLKVRIPSDLAPAGQLAGLLHPIGELSFVELVVLADV